MSGKSHGITFTANATLKRIDTGGLSVNCCALFKEAPTKYSLAN